MKKIEVTTEYPSDPESWVLGGYVCVDGEEVLRVEPWDLGHRGGEYFEEHDLLVMALKKLGIEVLVDGKPFFISSYNEEYHGKEDWG